MKLELKGEKKWIEHMYKHLRKEHPSTRHRMKICKKEKEEKYEYKEKKARRRHTKKTSLFGLLQP